MFKDLIQFIRDWYKTDGLIPLHEPRFSNLDRSYVMDAIDSTFVSSVGEYVDRFERNLASYVGAKRAVATVNGTAALQVALRLAGVANGDEVITQPLSFIATANAIIYNGAHPVFIDVDIETMGLSPEALGNFLDKFAEIRQDGVYNKFSNRRIAGILPMHTFGHPCKIKELIEQANSWDIPVVEDAAEAIGSINNGKHCGTFGKAGIFSFNGNKTITCGGGGAIVTSDEWFAEAAKHLTTTAKVPHPWEYIHDAVGYNFRMPNLNAALASAQLEQVEMFLADKRRLAEAYTAFFSDIDWGEFVLEPVDCRSNFWLNAVIVPDEEQRDKLLKVSNKAGVMTRPIWRLMSELALFKHCQTDSLINCKWLQKRVVNLPSSARQ
jgi:perosamine synthetase